MKRLLFVSLGMSFFLTSCYVYDTPGYTSVGVGVGYYDTLPMGWSHPYYLYNNRYYYGGNWQTGRFYHGGRYYPGRYYHQGRYIYGGRYHTHHSGGHGYPVYPRRSTRPRVPL